MTRAGIGKIVALTVVLVLLSFFILKRSPTVSKVEATLPDVVKDFLKQVDAVGHETKKYVHGAYEPATLGGLDSSGVVFQAMHRAGLLPYNYSYHGAFDQDVGAKHQFVGCEEKKRPGDLLALGENCEAPEVWAVVAAVDPEKSTPQSLADTTRLLDFSFEQNGYYDGAPRASLLAKKVCACVRHIKFEAAYTSVEPVPTATALPRPTVQVALLNAGGSPQGCVIDHKGKCPYPGQNEGVFRAMYLTQYNGRSVKAQLTLPSNSDFSQTIAAAGRVENGLFEFKQPFNKPGKFVLELAVDDKPIRTFTFELTGANPQ